MACIVHLVVATFLILGIWQKRVETKHVDNKTVKSARIGEILEFWEPDPRFKTNQPIVRRHNEDNSNSRINYGKTQKNTSDEVSSFSWESEAFSASDVNHAAPSVKTTATGTIGRRAQTTKTPKKLTRFTAMGLKDAETTTAHAVIPEHKNQENDVIQDDYEDNFVLSVYEIAEQYKKLLQEYPNANVTSEVIARTASYNDIWLFKISSLNLNRYFRTGENKYMSDVAEKKIVFIVHALNSMGLGKLYSLTVERYLKKLLAFYLTHLDKFDIFLIPMANPDGYLRVKRNTYWNKNTSPQPACLGVALDRNFDVAWNNSRKVSSCSQHFPGPRPFSEPESAAVADIFHKYSHKIIAYFHVHAGEYDLATYRGDAILYPRGFTDAQTSDDDKYIDLKAEVEEAIKNANFRSLSVTVDSLYNWYGKISGSSVDYAAAVYGIPYAMELVMQLYQDPMDMSINKFKNKPTEEIEYYALTEIWGRVINIIFMNIWTKLTGIDQDANEVEDIGEAVEAD